MKKETERMAAAKTSDIRTLLTVTTPVMMGYGPLGMVFGFLFVQQGAEWWVAPLMSLLLFAGAAQFLAIGLLAAGISIEEIAFACFIVNLRHIFYGISVRSLLPSSFFKKTYCIYTLTDENYSLLTGLDSSYVKENAFNISALNHFYWTFASLVGALIGESAEFTIPGIEFSLTALFTVLAIEQYRRNRKPILLLIVGLSYIIATVLAPDQTLFTAILISIFAALGLTALPIAQKENKKHG